MSSLNVDSGHRGRSRSPGRRESKRDSNGAAPVIVDAVRMPSPSRGYSYNNGYSNGYSNGYTNMNGNGNGNGYSSSYDQNPRTSAYDISNPRVSDPYRLASPTEESSYYRNGAPGSYPSRLDHKEEAESPLEQIKRGAESFLPAKYARKEDREERAHRKELKKEKAEDDLAYGSTASLTPSLPPRPEVTPTLPPRPESNNGSLYSQPPQWQYANPDQNRNYTSTTHYPPPPQYGLSPQSSGPNVVNATPLRVPTNGMASLSVNTPHHSGSLSLASAPGSPLLESYHGTYQSMSPMPSPLLLATNSNFSSTDMIEPLSPGWSDSEAGDKKKRRARFHDPVDDAERLAKALKGERKRPDTEPLIEILPGMTHSQLMELRTEYKRLVKTGPDRKGVNVAKHIRSRLKDSDEHLMKACYATALGKWESEAYWANFWYQGDKTRRELLIESLMGRTNSEIRSIKDAFKDKKYRDSLTHCMKTELKEDKFKKAILMVLDEHRMEDRDEQGRPLPIDRRLVEEDVEVLRRSVKSEKGGETAMLQIVILRSDTHLRDVLRLYERVYGQNFARDALGKSGNLVGEVLAHILNGVINKPVRDALLLHHALNASRKDELRRELLISRLVRFHWDARHMSSIKRAYRERYRRDLAEEVRDGTSGEWGLFCQQLVIMRMPGGVKQFDIVDAIQDSREKELRERDRQREWEREKEKEKEREREREKEKEKERERIREQEKELRRAERKREKEREEEREKEKEKEKERKSRARSGSYLSVGGSSKREKSRDRSRSRSRSRRD